MDDRLVRHAWESFIERGVADLPGHEAVLDSWARSRHHNIACDRVTTSALSDGELHRRRQSSGRLLEAAHGAIAQARSYLEGSQCMLILADAGGAVLENAGDRNVIGRGGDIGLGKGGLWREGDIGTNAIGTALATGRPLQIHASEHFCSRVQQWTCAAAPVRHPDTGAILGVVDLSGPPAIANPRNLAYAIAVAQQIETTLQHYLDADNASVLRRFLQRSVDWRADGLIAVGSSGNVIHANDAALRALRRHDAGLIENGSIPLLSRSQPGSWGRLLRQQLPHCELELVTEQGQGAGALIVVPGRTPMRTPTRAAARAAPATPRDDPGLASIIGDSPVMHEARENAAKFAAIAEAPVLIEGETGVGKELFAQAIHRHATPDAPFVPVNCGGLPRELIGSEIFGYVRGAFTGADSAGHAGKIEAAAGGTLCLDEIGEMPLDLQPYLLRVLEDGVVYRIGSHTPLRVHTRVLSMTNRDLFGECEHGRFRSDLLYRIAVLRLRVPPLRERGDDIVLLTEHFARRAAARRGQAAPRFSPHALDRLRRHHWPGNVRQLRNVVDSLVYLAERREITLDDLPADVARGDAGDDGARPGDLRSAEHDAIVAALRACHGNITQAARRLAIARSTLYCRIKRMHVPT